MVSLGCAKNRVDAEMLLYRLQEAGFEITNETSLADCVIVNTCGFIEAAKQESIEEILELACLKNEGKIKAIVVTGCLAERYKTEIGSQLPEVDVTVGLGGNEQIVQAVTAALNGSTFANDFNKLNLPLNGGRLQSTPRHYAYLKIADGCDNCCTYCAIPLIRGKFRSRKAEDIIAEAKMLANGGVKELLVIAQDTTRYGEDIYGKLALPALLNELCKIEGISAIRLLYCYPDRITDELLATVAAQEKILNYFDIPLQHCNERILKAMNRRGNVETLTQLIKKIRAKIPEVVIRTTFIAGFPSETQEEFDELLSYAKDCRFERMGCFAYSQEENTPAALLPQQIDEDEKTRRAEVLNALSQRIMDEFHQSLIGKSLAVITEGFDKYINRYFGRSYIDAPEVDSLLFFESAAPLAPGDIVDVQVTEIIDGELFGQLAI
ncbi:MAG: 30S ribosomal protein S12 methylthiotransferase RimO [Oscillospiraceae bacterium]|jgi:ribosomal protein S12 methylthiotransferase|nr:30S ribosomal protein S12 methylthiotransferase RimO [Oscillospiraceae bacterium]